MSHARYFKENFEKYDAENPQLWEAFEKYALQAAKYRGRFGARAIFQRIRWDTMVSGKGDYKITDGWCAHYARKFAKVHPEHKDLFTFSKLKYEDEETSEQSAEPVVR